MVIQGNESLVPLQKNFLFVLPEQITHRSHKIKYNE